MAERFSNEELYLAETVADYLQKFDLGSLETNTLLQFRKEVLCDRSHNQEYQCGIVTSHGWCCDTCLQHGLHELWKNGIVTVGSCCGHGGKYKPYIQVLSDDHVQKMHELGYVLLPVDEYGNVQRCFAPKTKLLSPATPIARESIRRDKQ